jgi:NADPH:quinone reductase
MGDSMRAVVYTGLGGPENIEVVDRPVPSVGEGEVLIRVLRAGVNAARTRSFSIPA